MIKKIFIIILIFCATQKGFCQDKKPDINLDFFNNFNDDCLFGYVAKAYSENYDLHAIDKKIEENRLNIKKAFAKELPTLSMGASYLGIKIPMLDNFELNKNSFILPFLAHYEADLLLKNRDKTKSIKKDWERAQYEQKASYISLLSDIGVNYINLILFDYLIELQEEIVKNQEKQIEFASKKLFQGIIDINSFEELEKKYLEEKNNYNKMLEERENVLYLFASLVNISPNQINIINRNKFNNFEYTKNIPNEIKNDVIYSRPDIIAIEKKLEKAKIDIKIARKEFLPTFNILGVWTFNTLSNGSFFSWENSIANLLVGLSQDIFQGGRKIANLKLQKVKYEKLFDEYKQADLNALKEVNTALCIIKYDTKNDNNKQKELNFQKHQLKNIEKKFINGVTSEPQLLEEKILCFKREEEKAKYKAQRLINYITLYKAVGGNI